ncbi:MAG: hypothetical protein SGI91_00325 [Alphaproteobacteria bacterium]|jgi:hypothetical protein|nr:hypothetical protein [Alphaproteobacteria bacterium]
MNRETEKEARAQTGAGPQITDMRTRVPGMEDSALLSLRVNATRLIADGNAKQKVAASELLPVVEAEILARKELKKASAPPKAPRVKKAKAVKKEDADEESAEAEALD